jgi:hypothetical protein
MRAASAGATARPVRTTQMVSAEKIAPTFHTAMG